MMHDGSIIFYEVTIATHGADITAIRQIHGLEMMLGGAALLARAFAPNTKISKKVHTGRHLICLSCMTTPDKSLTQLLSGAADG